MLFFYVCIVEFPRVLCAMFLLPSIVPCHSLTLLDTNQTKPRDSALSSAITRKKPLIVGSVCLCMQSPVECQYYSDHHNPLFLFLCSFLWLVFVSFQWCLFIAWQVFESFIFFFCLAYENEQILKIFFPRQVKRWMWNPSNDGFASCFFMIGGVGSTYFAVEKVLSHISHHYTLCNYIYAIFGLYIIVTVYFILPFQELSDTSFSL